MAGNVVVEPAPDFASDNYVRRLLEQFYPSVKYSPSSALRFYKEESKAGLPEVDGSLSHISSLNELKIRFKAFYSRDGEFVVASVDEQPSLQGGIIVLITGIHNTNFQFCRTLYLQPQHEDYFIRNDMLQFYSPSITVSGSSDADLAPSASLTKETRAQLSATPVCDQFAALTFKAKVATIASGSNHEQSAGLTLEDKVTMIGKNFVTHYYHSIWKVPDQVLQYYKEDSSVGRPGDDCDFVVASGIKEIKSLLQSVKYEKLVIVIYSVDAQISVDGCILVMLTKTYEKVIRRDDKVAIGKLFLKNYYRMLGVEPSTILKFYESASKMARPDEENGGLTTISTLNKIMSEIKSLGCRNVTVLSSKVQESPTEPYVYVLVKGCFRDKDGIEKLFMQAFVLEPQHKGFFISVDMLYYICRKSDEVAETVVKDYKTTSVCEAAKNFVDDYTHVLNMTPKDVSCYYKFEGKVIRESVFSKWDMVKSDITSVDAQKSSCGQICVLVTGILTTESFKRQPYTQLFVLSAQEVGYYISSDMISFHNSEDF